MNIADHYALAISHAIRDVSRERSGNRIDMNAVGGALISVLAEAVARVDDDVVRDVIVRQCHEALDDMAAFHIERLSHQPGKRNVRIIHVVEGGAGHG